jgi:hypothetical protein
MMEKLEMTAPLKTVYMNSIVMLLVCVISGCKVLPGQGGAGAPGAAKSRKEPAGRRDMNGIRRAGPVNVNSQA